MATFLETIKPYFTPCYRAHMLFLFDLWNKQDVQDNWDGIKDRTGRPPTAPGSMPKAGCPEGVWDDSTRQQFQKDFQDWKDGGFQ